MTQNLTSGPVDYVGQIHPWLTRYAELSARHTAQLDQYRDGDDVPEHHMPAYDEARKDNAIKADAFLDSLAEFLHELVGPPLPGTAFTLTFAGPERHDGEAPYLWVVNGSDLPDAGRTLLSLPSFREWLAEQGTYDHGSPPDVQYVADQSHPGLTYGYFNDLRREQAAQQDAPEPTAPGGAPALPPAPPLALLH
ncbi:hypothetical protein [Streptomyces chrestomyceticus]|uniref:hypothetical protein n=1 Tax=Streptomyces chrestomyceticus TaxID=68185 RepID=UPI0034022335